MDFIILFEEMMCGVSNCQMFANLLKYHVIISDKKYDGALSFGILVSFLIGIKCKVILIMKMCERRVLNKLKNEIESKNKQVYLLF